MHGSATDPDEAPRKTFAVLVTDDDPTSRMLVGAALADHAGQVVEAENGLKAVEALERQVFDIAILDLDMPVMDGFGVIERARARAETRHLPIIVITGRDDVVAIERAFALGATSFLCKPINWNIFRHQVAYVLRVARTERRIREDKERAEQVAEVHKRSLAALRREIGGAVGTISLLAEQAADSRFSDAVGAGERLRHVLNRVSRASAILTDADEIESAPVGVADVVCRALEMVGAELGAGAAARVDVRAGTSRRLVCDPALAAEALSEVLQNALRFAPLGIRVRLEVADAPGDKVRFEIEDRGPGIPEHVLERGFRPFEPGAAAGERGLGLGIGLPLAEAIMRAHGGHLGVMSEVGRGTEVFLVFPTTPLAYGEGKAKEFRRVFDEQLSDPAGISAS